VAAVAAGAAADAGIDFGKVRGGAWALAGAPLQSQACSKHRFVPPAVNGGTNSFCHNPSLHWDLWRFVPLRLRHTPQPPQAAHFNQRSSHW
jgi:hypothetical protein